MQKRTSRVWCWVSMCGLVLLLGGVADAKPAAAPQRAPAAQAPAQSSQGVVNINSAGEEQLQLLPRIGPSKARGIIKYRTRQKFKSTWDLVHVKGIGRKTYRLIRPFLTVQGETTLAKKAKLDQPARE